MLEEPSSLPVTARPVGPEAGRPPAILKKKVVRYKGERGRAVALEASAAIAAHRCRWGESGLAGEQAEALAA